VGNRLMKERRLARLVRVIDIRKTKRDREHGPLARGIGKREDKETGGYLGRKGEKKKV